MKKMFPFAVPSLRHLRVATIFSLGISLAFLILSLPDAAAQQNPARNPAKDIVTSGIGLGNKTPRGIWVDEGKQVMLVLDFRYKKIFTYCLDTGRRLDNHHNDRVSATATDLETTAKKAAVNEDDFFLFNTNAPIVLKAGMSTEVSNRYPGALTAANSKRFYPYQESNKLLLPNPYGIWANGTTNGSTLWVSDFDDDKIYAYDLTWHQSTVNTNKSYPKGTRATTKDIRTLDPLNENPHGIWVHGEIMWVANNSANKEFDKIFAYNWPGKTRNSLKDIPLTHDGNPYAQGIWSKGTTLWVANIAGSAPDDEQIIYAYDITSKARDPRKDFTALSGAGNDRPRGIWSDGTTMYVVDQTDNKIYAYNFTDHPNSALDFDTLQNAGNQKPKGMWSDGETMWVVDAVDKELYAYDFFTKERLSDKDFDTLDAAGNDSPTGIWSNGETMWVADWDDNKIYAYKMLDKSRDPSKDFDTLDVTTGANDNESEDPIGIWSNRTTMWVADTEDDKVYAYKMSDKSRDSDRDIDVKALIGNVYLQGVWSDGTTMWVADFIRTKSEIHAFTLPVEVEDKNGVKSVKAASRVDAKDLKVLALANKKARGIWSDETTMWVTDDDPDNGKIYAYRLSDAASLGELKMTGHIPSPEYGDFDVQLKINDEPEPFNSGIIRYTASVPYATASLTIAPTLLRTGDADSILPGDSSTTEGHQVNLDVGENTISITVDTPETDTTSRPQTRTYTVVVTREFFTYNDPSKNFTLHSANSTPKGIFSDGTTLWVANDGDDKIYAYKLSDKSRDSNKDIPLAESTTSLDEEDNSDPRGIWANATTMWVLDSEDDKIYAYKLSDKSRDSDKDIPLNSINSDPQWIWSDGVTMWVTDTADSKIYAYEMSEKEPSSIRDISLERRAGDNAHPTGICSDGANLWVANNGANNAKIYSYKLAAGTIDCREETKDFNTLEAVGNTDPEGIFSDGTTMWVVDSEKKKIFAYNQPLSANNKLKRLELSGVYQDQTSMLISEAFSSGTREDDTYNAYVVYSTASTTVTALAQDPDAGVAIQPEDADANTDGHQINLADGDNTITITVTAENAAVKEYTVNVTRKSAEPTPSEDIALSTSASPPRAIWSDGTTWRWAGANRKIYVYNSANSVTSSSLSAGNANPQGLWSDNATEIRVTDNVSKKIYFYDLSMNPIKNGSNDKIANIPSPPGANRTSQHLPRGLWSEGTTIWVANEGVIGTPGERKIYAYTIVSDASGTRLAQHTNNITLNATNSSPRELWSNGTTMWVEDTQKIYAYNMWTNNVQGTPEWDGVHDQPKDIDISSLMRNQTDRGIWSNGTTMWVVNGRNLHAFNLPQPGATGTSGPSEDSTLSDLRLSGVTLTPTFSPDYLFYTALVDHNVASTKVTATTNDSKAAVDILWSSNLAATIHTAGRGPQVSLQEGDNFIAIDVQAENGIIQTYLVEVTKAEAPPVSGGPLPQPQSFQLSATSSASQADLTGSAAGIREWKSRLFFAESLLDGGVRFVFLVPAGEFQMEENADLTSREWRPLPEDTFQSTRESLGDGTDRLTIILPKTEGKQRFLRLTPQR